MINFDQEVEKALALSYQDGLRKGFESVQGIADLLGNVKTLEELKEFTTELLMALKNSEFSKEE